MQHHDIPVNCKNRRSELYLLCTHEFNHSVKQKPVYIYGYTNIQLSCVRTEAPKNTSHGQAVRKPVLTGAPARIPLPNPFG